MGWLVREMKENNGGCNIEKDEVSLGKKKDTVDKYHEPLVTVVQLFCRRKT